jgi:O-Antigen ligase/Tetratricopeptide repeat
MRSLNRALAVPAPSVLPTLRAAVSPQVGAALLGFVVVIALGASDGGYWPQAWSWTALALSWCAVLALLVRETIRIGSAERVTLLCFAALLAWILLSILWSSSTGRTVLEAERALAYLTVLLAALLIVRARAYRALLGGTWAGIAIVSSYALATRLFPERLGVFDPIAGYRLSEPLGYWNALAIFAGLGALLALGLAARSESAWVSALAAASLLVFLPAMYFTFSRGAWIAVGVGLASAIALDPRRLQLITAALALTVAPAIGLAVAYSSDALTQSTASLSSASSEGHRLALVLALLAVGNAGVAVGLKLAERGLSPSPTVRLAYVTFLGVLLAVGLTTIFVRFGSPPTLVKRAYDELERPTTALKAEDLNRRLFTFSSRTRVLGWKAAWADFEDHRLLGSGAGTYELYWAEHRTTPTKVRDAHSLYLETLAELGPVGLALLAGALAVPIVAGIKARRRGLVPAALGAYAAYLVHAGVDWDWEMMAVTVAALFCGAAMLAGGRRASVAPLSWPLRLGLVAACLVLAATAFVGAIGNQRVADARDALTAGEWTEAEDHARSAMPWMPWSSEPWQVAGEAQLARGELEPARRTLSEALEKDPADWELWLDLSLASKGSERREAAAQAVRLNPLGRELAGLRELLGIGAPS